MNNAKNDEGGRNPYLSERENAEIVDMSRYEQPPTGRIAQDIRNGVQREKTENMRLYMIDT